MKTMYLNWKQCSVININISTPTTSYYVSNTRCKFGRATNEVDQCALEAWDKDAVDGS